MSNEAGRVLGDDGDFRYVELSVVCGRENSWGHEVVQKVAVFGGGEKVVLHVLHSQREPVDLELTFREMDTLGEAFQAFCQARGYTFEQDTPLVEERRRFLDELPY